MAAHDPMRLRQSVESAAEGRASWQTGGVHYFHYSHYCDPWRLVAPYVGGFRIARVWDAERPLAESFARLFTEPPRVCATPEEVSDEVDLVFLADCNGDGSDHPALAAPGLKKGVATFVDKPLADSLASARALQDLADTHRAPLFSASLLQVGPGVEAFRGRLPEIGRVDSGIVTGFNFHPAALIHSICAALSLFGSGISEVGTADLGGHRLIHLRYGAEDRPRYGVLIRAGEADYRWTTFHASAHGHEGAIQAPIYSDFRSEGTAQIIRLIQDLVRHKRVPALHREMMEAVAVMEAVLLSERQRRPMLVGGI
jgi:predicted dehydrogenase